MTLQNMVVKRGILGKKGLILVDTKYEFGKDVNGKIILIDEIHTCDSSRVWKRNSYQNRYDNIRSVF